MSEIRELITALNNNSKDPSVGTDFFKATVSAVNAGTPPTVNLSYLGQTVPGIRVSGSYVPQVGDVVHVIWHNGSMLVLDRTSDGSIRGPVVHRHAWNGSASVVGTNVLFYSITLTPSSNCWFKYDIGFRFETDEGASGQAVEPCRGTFIYKFYRVGSPDVLLYTSYPHWHMMPLGHDSWNYNTPSWVPFLELVPVQLTKGSSYRIDFIGTDYLTLKNTLYDVAGTISEVYRGS